MKNTYILLLVSAAFFAADSLYPADKYFGDTSAVFTSNTAWFSDEARTERTTPPTSGEDTAIFYKTTGKDCWITQIDTYVGNIVSAVARFHSEEYEQAAVYGAFRFAFDSYARVEYSLYDCSHLFMACVGMNCKFTYFLQYFPAFRSRGERNVFLCSRL